MNHVLSQFDVSWYLAISWNSFDNSCPRLWPVRFLSRIQVKQNYGILQENGSLQSPRFS